ncbi:MAG: ShlB/FhaC/HecB family hemolysin secretion/activation protein, partial [Variovorax sp.]
MDACDAQSAPAPRPFVEEQRQQERERLLRGREERGIDQRGPEVPKARPTRLPSAETPCFPIDRILLQGESIERFHWSLSHIAGNDGSDPPLGRCLGAEGVDIVVSRVQQSILERGYLTTRVLAGPQDLRTGALILTLVPGRIATIRQNRGDLRTMHLRNAIPARSGDLLELRDIEQGLENLKRLPTVDADVQVEPSTATDARPGDSDLLVTYTRKFPLRTTLSLDDTGTRATGKTQSALTVAWDGPLGLNDLAYVSINRDVFNHHGRGTGGRTAHYAIPFGYGLLAFTASESRYHQTVAGLDEDYLYAGSTRNAEVRWSQLIHRSRSRKTTVALRGWRRATASFIDDTEIEVQRRVVGGWEASLNQREFLGDATLDATVAYRRGTGVFGAIAAPEEAFGDGTSRLKLYTSDVALNAPFRIAGQKLRYTASWRALMVRIAPSLEAWARGNSLLRRCRLVGDDDARAVMVAA